MDTNAPLRITLLGALRAQRADEVVTRFRSQKAGGLLAYLALFPRRVHTREQLADLFWPDADLEVGRTNLRSALASLRRQLEPPGVEAGAVLVTRGHSDVFLNRSGVETDVAAFERALAGAAASAASEKLRLLSEAIVLYGGPLLPGRYEDWAITERDRLSGLYLGALRDLAWLHEASGDWPQALDASRRAVVADPLAQEPHLDILRLLTASGQSSAAKRHYAEMVRLFDAELGVEPPQEARALLASVSTTRVSSAPVIPHFVVPSPLMPSAPVAASPVHLPLMLTRFFGRGAEGALIAAALRGAERTRLLTLTGTGGSGKTRLAVEAARAVAPDFLGGVWFVPLAELRDAGRFFEIVASVLRLPQITAVEPRDQVIEALQRQGEAGPILLVLDNFEQIVDEGAVHAAEMLTVPAVSCLVTSRRRLLLDGEEEFPLQPLPTPAQAMTPEELLSFPSVQLFVARAQAARPDFQLTERNAAAIARLCRHLEGIPLALELAAAWAQVLSPVQMLERLTGRFDLLVSRRRDIPGRHATLRATLEWSYQLLTDDSKRFFAGLSVFSGDWTLEAAEDVLQEPRALEYIAELQDHSLILPVSDVGLGMPPRFGMLETLREFAAEKITNTAERERLAHKHFLYCLRLAEAAAQCLRGPGQVLNLSRLECERDNLHVALVYSLRSDDEGRRQDGLRLAAALGWFWFRRSLFREGCEWLEAALGVAGDSEARIRVLHAYAFLINYQGDYVGACEGFREALALAEAIGEERHAVYSLYGLGMMSGNCPDPTEGVPPFHVQVAASAECVRRGAATGDRRLIAYGLFVQAFAALHTGDFAMAQDSIGRAGTLFRELDDIWETANALSAQGVIYHFSGDLQTAASSYAEAIRLAQESDYGIGVFWGLYGLASVNAREGHADRAARLFGAAAQLAESIHIILPEAARSMHNHDVAAARAQIGDSRFAVAWGEGRALMREQAISLALSAAP